MAPLWLTAIAWISLALGFLSAGTIVYDIFGRGRRQPMRVMEAVWPSRTPGGETLTESPFL